LRPLGDSLALQTLFYAEDIRARDEIDDAVGGVELKEPELDLAKQIIQSLMGEWEPDEFENEYRGQLKQLLEAKLAGAEFVAPEPVEEAPVVDLMEALRRSVDEARERKTAAAADGKAKKSPSRSRAKAKA
jgi:DNA end-binding protein Ku